MRLYIDLTASLDVQQPSRNSVLDGTRVAPPLARESFATFRFLDRHRFWRLMLSLTFSRALRKKTLSFCETLAAHDKREISFFFPRPDRRVSFGFYRRDPDEGGPRPNPIRQRQAFLACSAKTATIKTTAATINTAKINTTAVAIIKTPRK